MDKSVGVIIWGGVSFFCINCFCGVTYTPILKTQSGRGRQIK
jgi:hypothetical protein